MHHVCKARIRTEGIHIRIDLQPDHPRRIFVVRSIQPEKRVLFVAGQSVIRSNSIDRHIRACDPSLYFFNKF